MLSDFSSSQEIKPLLENSKKQTEKTSSSRKYFYGVGLLLASIVMFMVLSKNIHHGKNSKFVSTNTWSVLESIETKYIPQKWKFDSLCDNKETIQLTFAIKQQNTDLLHEKLYEVSDPSSSKFGKHWSMEDIHELVKPKDSSIETILDWLSYYKIDSNDIEYLTMNKDFIRVKTTIQVANEMLQTEYGYWVSKDGEKHMRVKEGYFVPSTIAEHLDFISPTLRFPPRRHTSKIEMVNIDTISTDSSVIYNTPERLRSLYHMEDYINLAKYPTHFQSIASFLGEWFTNSDIETFWKYFDVDNVDLVRVPAFQPSGEGDEAELDIEYITSTGSGINTYVWDIEDDLYFITLVQQIISSGSPPSVVSMSYGGDEQSNGFEYCNRGNLEFAKIGLFGVTALASSGDSGVTGDSETCSDEYFPSFPASSPYVVAVGGTIGGDIQASLDSNTGETAWLDSGGGFSWFFARQAWQDTAVQTYYDTVSNLPLSSKYNSLGRGYPDISAQSVSFIICVSSEFWSVSGTSCSCPTVAGMIALINDVRLQNGKSPLGWMLPSLYQILSNNAYYVNDVVSGYNVGCAVDNDVGFRASNLWDPVTGFGSIKYPRLFQALADL